MQQTGEANDCLMGEVPSKYLKSRLARNMTLLGQRDSKCDPKKTCVLDLRLNLERGYDVMDTDVGKFWSWVLWNY